MLKDNLEKDLASIRTEVDTKNIELNGKVQTSIHDLRDEVIEKVNIVEHKIIESQFENGHDYAVNIPSDDNNSSSPGTKKAIMDLKNKLHQNCNTLRWDKFLLKGADLWVLSAICMFVSEWESMQFLNSIISSNLKKIAFVGRMFWQTGILESEGSPVCEKHIF